MESMLTQFFRPSVNGRMPRSATLLSIGKKDAQEIFLIDAVLKALVGVASCRNFGHGIFHPRLLP